MKTLIHSLCAVALLLQLTGPVFAGGSTEHAQPGDVLAMEFTAIEEIARETQVRFYMWGGSDTVNSWIDGFVAERMDELYGIDLVRVPMDAAVFVNKLLTEKQAGLEEGTIDVLWINGENFRNAKEADLLLGPFTEILPNFNAFVDPVSAATDAGFPVDGFEAPYGRAQFNFDYDSARVARPPRSFAELSTWVRENPGRFTYPQPPDFTGSAFLRQAFYALTGGFEQYLDGFDTDLFARNAPAVWQFFNEIEPYLWQGGESYPRDLAALDALFERGEVDFTMSFTQTNAATRIAQGRYPETAGSFVFTDGSLFNTHFLAVPFNSPNSAGALTLINFLLSPEAQYSKNRLENWGDFTVLSIDRLPSDDQARFAALDLGDATVSPEEFARYGVPEIPSEYWEALEEGWDREVRAR